MKTILLFLLAACSCWGQAFTLRDPAFVGQKAPAAAGCSGTTVLTNNAYADSNFGLGNDASTVYRATWFIPSSNMTVVTIAPYVRGLTASANYNFRAAIYTSDANTNPTSLVGSWSSYLAASTVSLSAYGYVSMPGDICASLTAGTRYFVVLNSDAVDAVHQVLWGNKANVLEQRGSLNDADGVGTWTVSGAATMCGFQLKGGP